MGEPLSDSRRAGRQVTVEEAAGIGIGLCRDDRWKEGLQLLGRVAARDCRQAPVPAEIYAYLGYGCARYEHQVRAGLVLCQRAVKGAGDKPDGYLYLARIYLLSQNRRRAVRWLYRGLRAVPDSVELRELRRQLGVRRPPVVAGLSRSHPANRLLGRLRARLSAS